MPLGLHEEPKLKIDENFPNKSFRLWRGSYWLLLLGSTVSLGTKRKPHSLARDGAQGTGGAAGSLTFETTEDAKGISSLPDTLTPSLPQGQVPLGLGWQVCRVQSRGGCSTFH